MAEVQTTQKLFELQTNEILSLRDNVTEIEPVTSTEDDEKTLYSSYYSGEQDGVKYHYRFYFIRFKSTDDMTWISFNGMPSVVEKNKEAIDDIISKVQNAEAEKEIEEWKMPKVDADISLAPVETDREDGASQKPLLNDMRPMVMLGGKTYYDTGRISTIDGRCGVMDGEITSTVDGTQAPTEDNQSNFGSGYEYQFVAENTVEIIINEKWCVFGYSSGQ